MLLLRRLGAIWKKEGAYTAHITPFFAEEKHLGENRYELLLYDSLKRAIWNVKLEGPVKLFELEGANARMPLSRKRGLLRMFM